MRIEQDSPLRASQTAYLTLRSGPDCGAWAQCNSAVERAFVDLARILEQDGELDAEDFANRIAAAAVPDEYRLSASVAVDGTDLETWGALHGDPETVELDGEAAEVDPVNDAATSHHRKRPPRRARVFGTGPDGRHIYTKDRDARAGHRSATNSRPAGPYIGFELHLAVQARDVHWTNSIDRTTLGPEVPAVVTSFSLLPAGSHRAKAVVPALLRNPTIKNVVRDPGYSLCRPETAVWPLAEAGIETCGCRELGHACHQGVRDCAPR